MHEKTSWDRLAELFALPPCGGQQGTELLAAMQRLKPEDPELWFRWQYVSRLPEWIQRQLAEDTSPVQDWPSGSMSCSGRRRRRQPWPPFPLRWLR